ncbi:hypothetical protein AVEN_250313-1 [Araneus ventricosus]|uniref:Uncharacterized protein n=1 Tax=Araneus ventricosus TaxID=182803 RepID=A0A4Y2FIB4_ARAVE|nr:hypothetical protein AVEN_250313-1 [Araneus ventricosus]
MRLGSVIDHPLFGWSNYDGNKSPTTVVECRNTDLGTGLFYLFALEKIISKASSFFLSHTVWGPKFSSVEGAPLAIGQAGNLARPPLTLNIRNLAKG